MDRKSSRRRRHYAVQHGVNVILGYQVELIKYGAMDRYRYR
jgi:hypothetical protein